MAKKLLAMVLGLTMMIGVAGCSAVDTGSGSNDKNADTQVSVSAELLDAAKYKSDKEPADWTIAVVVKDGTSDWFKRMQVGVDEFGKEKTVDVIQKGPANADAASQVQLVEDMINQGVDALCIVPIDPGALESVLKKAMEKGIVVISHEASDLKSTLYDVEAFTAEDFGNTMMQELAKAMGEKGQYAQMVAYTTSTTHALKGVDLTIKKGETHCLAGENGCGKSTIIKVISGFYKPDEGTIEIDGKEYTNMSTADAIAAGIQVIYQDFSIFPNLTVMENLAFNQVLAEKKKFVNKREFRKIAEEAVKKINFDVDLDARVETLPVADKQLIAISRALLHNAKLIIMDEPTTALTKKEVTRLFGIIEELKKEGITILFVSHKLDEVFEISDSITILRTI